MKDSVSYLTIADLKNYSHDCFITKLTKKIITNTRTRHSKIRNKLFGLMYFTDIWPDMKPTKRLRRDSQ